MRAHVNLHLGGKQRIEGCVRRPDACRQMLITFLKK